MKPTAPSASCAAARSGSPWRASSTRVQAASGRSARVTTFTAAIAVAACSSSQRATSRVTGSPRCGARRQRTPSPVAPIAGGRCRHNAVT